eukprot:4061037-Ditylum_brightwellii.AAC.1
MDVKKAWKERAHKLNQQPLQGDFQVLPAADTLGLMKTCLQEDLSCLKTLDSALRHNNQRELKTFVMFPYPISVESQCVCTSTVSSLLMGATFGNGEQSKFLSHELVSEIGGDPSTYHTCSRAQICNI